MHNREIKPFAFRVTTLVAIFIFGLPLTIIAHEVGHFLAARAFGYPAHLSYASVYAVYPKDEYEGFQGFVFTSAGPLVNFFLALVGLFGLFRFSKVLERSKWRWIQLWVLTGLAVNGFRGLSKALSPSGSDEADIVERLGLTETIGLVLMAAPSLIFVVFVIHSHYRLGTLRWLFVGLATGGVGVTLWLNTIGPLVLPRHIPESEQDTADNRTADWETSSIAALWMPVFEG